MKKVEENWHSQSEKPGVDQSWTFYKTDLRNKNNVAAARFKDLKGGRIQHIVITASLLFGQMLFREEQIVCQRAPLEPRFRLLKSP